MTPTLTAAAARPAPPLAERRQGQGPLRPPRHAGGRGGRRPPARQRPTADPAAAARAYLARERALFGLSPQQVDGLEVVSVNPLGKGAAVLLRQVFGDLRTAHDGLVSVGVVDGTVVSVTSSLTRGTAQPQTARLTQAQAVEIAQRDAGTEGGSTSASSSPCRSPRAPARPGRSSSPPPPRGGEGYASYVDAVTGEVLLREDLVDHASDDPSWKVFTSNPPADYSSADTRTHLEPDGQRRQRGGPRPRHRPGVGHPAGRPDADDERQLGAHGRDSRRRHRPRDPGPDLRDRPHPHLRLDLDQRLVRGELQPRRADGSRRGRHRRRHGQPVRHAQPDARLVLPPRLHRGRPGTCRRPTAARRRLGGDAGAAATPRPAAAVRRRLRGRNNANQITPPRRRAADHQHVPVAADAGGLLRAVRRRRLRHDR